MSFNDIWNSEEFFTFFMFGIAVVGIAIIIVSIVKYNNSKTTSNYNRDFLTSNEKTSTKICRNCGCYISPSASTCSNCGTATKAKMPITSASNEWRCPKCGRVNQNYVGTCGCGQFKPK